MEMATKIDGYEIDLDTDMNGDGDSSPDRVTGCWINKGNYGASLEVLTQELILNENGGDGFLAVNQNTIRKIESWALKNGY